MHPPQSPDPFERPDDLVEMLREQGASSHEIYDVLPTMRRLAEWQAPQPSAAATQRLLAQMSSTLPAFSPVRQAIRQHWQRRDSGVGVLLATARVQVNLFGLAFWLISALITVVGGVVVLIGKFPDHGLLLRASGPFLAYLGTTIAFRGTRAHALECELACPPSSVLLTLARLVIVLGYDVGLALVLSLAFWAGGAAQAWALTLSWFMPLLLVTGIALLLTLRLSVQTAASLAYGCWLAVLAINTISNFQMLPLTPLSDTLLGGVGLVLVAVTLSRLPADIRHLLPSS